LFFIIPPAYYFLLAAPRRLVTCLRRYLLVNFRPPDMLEE